MAAADGREARAGSEDGGDDVRTGAEPAERAREEREREAGVGPRQRGYESSVGAGVSVGEVGAYGREHVGEAVRGGVEGGELREDGRTRARGARGDREAPVELSGEARGDRAASAYAAARGHTDAAVPDFRTSGSGAT
jgi:hypothetical protein